MKAKKTIYWIATGLLTLQMLFSVWMYFFNHEGIREAFIALGYPTYIIYPLAILKLLGLVAILTKKSEVLKEWAYAGFFFDFVLAFFAHVMVGDGQQIGAVLALIFWTVSYWFDKQLFVRA